MSSSKVSLARPALPLGVRPRVFAATTIAVFGRDEDRFADALALALTTLGHPPLRMRVLLRHAAGFERRGDALFSHPDALADAILSLDPDRFTLGVGAGFNLGVEARYSIYISDDARERPPRPVHLRLTRARISLAEPLAQMIAERL